MRYLKRKNPLQLAFPYREQVSEVLFFVSYFVFLASSYLGDTSLRYDYSSFRQWMFRAGWFAVVLAVINCLLLKDYTVRQLLLLTGIGVCLAVSFLTSGYRWFYQSYLILLAARGVSWRRIVDWSMLFYAVFLLGIAALYHFEILYSLNLDRNGVNRVDLGFIQPNLFASYLLVMAMLWMCMRYDRMNWKDYLVFGFLAGMIAYLPKSRSVCIILLITMGVSFAMKLWGDKLIVHRRFQWICMMVYPGCFLLSLMGGIFYNPDNRFWEFIDNILSFRISMASFFHHNYPNTLWGQRLALVSTNDALLGDLLPCVLDNSYMRLFLNLGMVTTAIAMLMLMVSVWYAIKRNQQPVLLGLLLFAIYGLSEFKIARITSNVFLIVFVYALEERLLTFQSIRNFFLYKGKIVVGAVKKEREEE